MNAKYKVEVMEPEPVFVAARRSGPPAARKSWSRAIGMIGTLCLHGLVIQSVVLGARAPKIKPPVNSGSGASRMTSATPPAETLILINLLNARTVENDILEDLSSSGIVASDLPVAILSPDPLPVLKIQPDQSDESAVNAPVDAGDLAGRAAMFGRYTGQIDARIERAWRRPRSAVGINAEVPGAGTPTRGENAIADGQFSCQVRIVQDPRGYVLETQLLRCNGNSEWQLSLVRAINQSSPLPAPPNPSVFSAALTMTFTANVYRPGRPVEDYELDMPRAPQSIPGVQGSAVILSAAQ